MGNQTKIQTMSARSDCALAAARAYQNKTAFSWGNQRYKVEKVKQRGDKDIEVHMSPWS